MIDKMIRCKNLNVKKQIESLNDWFDKCPPQGKEKHWKDGRSAKETAKHWVYTIPQPFKDLLGPLNLKYKLCGPEFVSKFDPYKGNSRNHDLLLLAKNENKDNVIISIESKVDESFGNTVAKQIIAADKKKLEKPKSKAVERIAELRIALFGEINDNQLELRYQLLTAVAGTIAESKAQNSKTAYFVIQTFISDDIDPIKNSQNQKDINDFLNVLSKSSFDKMDNNTLLGPFRIQKSTEFLPNDIDLFLGKYEILI